MRSQSEERRSAKRVSYRVEAEWMGADRRSLKTRTKNLSTGGAFIESLASFPVGAILKLKFRAGEAEVNVLGEVCYCLPEVGMGIRFLNLSAEDHAAIESVVQERAKRVCARAGKREAHPTSFG